MLNFNLGFPAGYHHDGHMYVGPVFQYLQNENGACSILGNVSEICFDGSIFGGNWYEPPTTVQQGTALLPPDARIGFRVFMEILEYE